ncbi:MAG TPA: hypothetical protein VHP83_01755 [Aggregatilineaceae bacterium]|nr:hypothetical protein [Aggregatilineaceae bacterium]
MKKGSFWYKLQRGQALMEYWPTIPATLMILVTTSMIVSFLNGSYMTVVDELGNPGGFDCEQEQDEKEEGPDLAQLDCHSVQLVGKSYDEGTDRTTVAYKVTSGCNPSISNWVLGIPKEVADKIVSSSEPYQAWSTDPNSGQSGIKFETGYESSGDGGGGGGKGGGKKLAFSGNMFSRLFLETDERVVVFTIDGHYDWSVTYVTVKAGTQVFYSTITAPTTPYTEEEEDQCK